MNTPGEQGYTPLHLAAKFAYPNLVEYLLSRGARTDMLTRDEKTARELAMAKQERSHAQQEDMLAAFDKFDAESKRRPKLLPGAPLPPDPRIATGHYPAHGQAHAPSGAQPMEAPLSQPLHQCHDHHYHHLAQQSHKQQPWPQMPNGHGRRGQGHSGMNRTAMPVDAPSALPHWQQQWIAPPPARAMHEPSAQAAQSLSVSADMRPDQAADRAAAATRLRAMGSRPW